MVILKSKDLYPFSMPNKQATPKSLEISEPYLERGPAIFVGKLINRLYSSYLLLRGCLVVISTFPSLYMVHLW